MSHRLGPTEIQNFRTSQLCVSLIGKLEAQSAGRRSVKALAAVARDAEASLSVCLFHVRMRRDCGTHLHQRFSKWGCLGQQQQQQPLAT